MTRSTSQPSMGIGRGGAAAQRGAAVNPGSQDGVTPLSTGLKRATRDGGTALSKRCTGE